MISVHEMLLSGIENKQTSSSLGSHFSNLSQKDNRNTEELLPETSFYDARTNRAAKEPSSECLTGLEK